MSYKTHKLLIIREHLGSPLVFGGVRVAQRVSFLCFVLFVFILSWCIQCCQCLWIVHSWFRLRFSLMLIRNEIKNRKYHIVVTVQKSNRKQISIISEMIHSCKCFLHESKMPTLTYKPVKQCDLKPTLTYKPVKQCDLKPTLTNKPVKKCDLKPTLTYKLVKQCDLQTTLTYKPVKQCDLQPTLTYKPVKQCDLKPTLTYKPVKKCDLKNA